MEVTTMNRNEIKDYFRNIRIEALNAKTKKALIVLDKQAVRYKNSVIFNKNNKSLKKLALKEYLKLTKLIKIENARIK
jgi:hypothetical protein